MSKYIPGDYKSPLYRIQQMKDHADGLDLTFLSKQIDDAVEKARNEAGFLSSCGVTPYNKYPSEILLSKKFTRPKQNQWDYAREENWYNSLTNQEKLDELAKIQLGENAVIEENRIISEHNCKVYNEVHKFLVGLGMKQNKKVIARTKEHTVTCDWIDELRLVCKTSPPYSQLNQYVNIVKDTINKENSEKQRLEKIEQNKKNLRALNLEVLKYTEKYGLPSDTHHDNILNNLITSSVPFAMVYYLKNGDFEKLAKMLSKDTPIEIFEAFEKTKKEKNESPMMNALVAHNEIKADFNNDYKIIQGISDRYKNITSKE